jgi:FMN-dependent NADH-azoreductase
MKLLHIDTSIQGHASVTRALSTAAVEQLREANPDVHVTYRDLAAHPLPHMDQASFATASAHPVLREFLAADTVVIGAPMYNFGVPSQLKTWIDHIAIAGQTFRYTSEGVIGLAGGKRVIVAHSRGGLYADVPSAPVEHAESHLRAILAFIGIAAPEFIVAEGVALGAERRETAVARAMAQVRALTPREEAQPNEQDHEHCS